jgi:thioredoxin reductase
VLHCPYCHGWEVRDQAIGVLGSDSRAVHLALLLRQWSDDVTYFSHTSTASARLAAEDAKKFAARGISVVDGEVESLHVVDDRLAGVRLKDGTLVHRQALAVPTRMVARADFLANLGLKPVEHPSGNGRYLSADPAGRTDVPGVWAAGNVTDLMAWVGNSAAAGAMAGAQINADLVNEETEHALATAQ